MVNTRPDPLPPPRPPRPARDPVQHGVSLALEAHRRGLLDDRGLDAILAYYDAEGSRDPFPPDEILVRLGGVAPEAAQHLVHGTRLTPSDVQGERFNDRLTLLEPIGEGGMGTVWRAYDRVLKRVVAIKRLRIDHLDGPAIGRVTSRFEREAHAMARVRHPACVQIYDAGLTDKGEPYLVMEFVAGKSLRGLLEQTPRAPARQVAAWGVALADALQACHDVGLIHRDVKPANVLLDAQGKPHLTDFGVALDDRAQTKITVDKAMVGTLCYMPPEQALGERVDARSDVYGLGATLFEALTGRPPFDAGATLVLLRQVLDADAPTVRSLRRDCPEDLDTIVNKCVSKPAADRYATAQALALDLRRFLADEPVLATRVSPVGRLGRRLWRHRRLLGASLAALALLGAGLAANHVHAREQRRAAIESALSTAAVASDLDAAEADVLALIAVAEPDQADRGREALRALRGRRRLADSERSIARWRTASTRAREAQAEADALREQIDPQQPYRESPDKKRATALLRERDAAERDAAVAVIDAERSLALAAADLDGPEVDRLRARLLIERARALERSEPDDAEALFAEAATLNARSGGRFAAELAPPVVEVRSPTPGAEAVISVYVHDPDRGRQLPREISRGPVPAHLAGAGADEYVVEVSAPGHLPCRELMLLTRGERRTFEVALFSRESLGPLADMVVHIPPGEARWGERLEKRARVETGYLMLRTEVMVDQWGSFVLVAQHDGEYRPTLPHAQINVNQAALWPTFGLTWEQVQEFVRWLQSELDLANLPYTLTLPTDHQLLRSIRGELPWIFPWGNEIETSFTCTLDSLPHTQLSYSSILARLERTASRHGQEDVSGFDVASLAGGACELVTTAGEGTGAAFIGGTFTVFMRDIVGTIREPVMEWTSRALHSGVGFRWVLRPTTRDTRSRPSKTPSDGQPERLMAEARRLEQTNLMMSEARRLEQTNDISGAAALATRAIAADPFNSIPWRFRADLRRRAGDEWGAAWDAAVAATRR